MDPLDGKGSSLHDGHLPSAGGAFESQKSVVKVGKEGRRSKPGAHASAKKKESDANEDLKA